MRQEIVTAWADETWPLSVTVCWIAARGDASKLDDFDVLEVAANELFQALKSGRIIARGVRARGGDRTPEIIPREKFTKATPFGADTPFEMIFCDKPALEFRALVDWSDGDRIACRGEAIWRELEVYRADAQKNWPARVARADGVDPSAASGEAMRLDNGVAAKPTFSRAQFEREYDAYITAAKNDGRETVEREDCAAFPNVSRGIVREVRRATVPEWTGRGRRKSRKSIRRE